MSDCSCDISKGFNPDIESINLDCSKTWDLICSGNTVGCFQLESRLARTACKKARPRRIEELCDVISIIRPGPLESKLNDGKSITDHYYRRKSLEESPDTVHHSLDNILNDTYGLLIYQEQIIKIMQELAGFTETEADLARRAVGKKKTDLMAQVKRDFILGCEKTKVVSSDIASEIFDWIEKSQRYLFNASHGLSYSLTGYQTCYAKAHFPVEFFLAQLNSAKEKAKTQEEIGRLHEDMKKNNIYLEVPDIRCKNPEFVYQDGVVKYGLSFIKSVGDKGYEQIESMMPADINSMNFTEVLFKFLIKIKKSSAKVLMATGALDFLRISREKMLFIHEQCINLKEKEVQYIVESCNLVKLSPTQCIADLCNQPTGRGQVFYNKRRKSTVDGILNSLQFPPYSLKDDIKSLATREESFLGSSISCSKFDLLPKRGMKCGNFEDSERFTHQITAQIKRINDLRDKNGNEMAFLVIGDDSGTVENAIMFSGPWDEFKDRVRLMGIYEFRGVKDAQKDSFNINSLKEVFV